MDFSNFIIPEEDRPSFVKILAYLAQADKKITLEEKQAIDDIIISWELSDKDINQIYEILENGTSLNKLLDELHNRKTHYLLLQELITLANIDGSYDISEKEAVKKIASYLKISDTRVIQLEKWVIDGINWRERGAKLIQPEKE
jgi:uncharacterized tellurite resistance protein B-like protein